VDADVLQILKDKGDMATQIVDRLKGLRSSPIKSTSTKVPQNKVGKTGPRPFTNPSQSLILDSGGGHQMEIQNQISQRKECRRLLVEVANMHPETYQTRYAHLAPNLKAIIQEANSDHLLNAREIALIMKEGGIQMIGLDNKPKGGWNWDETTGKIIRRDEDGTVEHLDTVNTLEEAQERIRQLQDKQLARLGLKNKKEETKMSKKSRKEAKAAQKTQEPEEVMEEAVEELEEVVEEETKAPAPKSKKAQKAEKKAATKTEAPAPEKKTKKAEKATPAPAEKKGKETKETDATTNEVSAKELAAELNIDPKVLRKTLRELFPDHESKERWVWKRGSKDLERLVKKLQKS